MIVFLMKNFEVNGNIVIFAWDDRILGKLKCYFKIVSNA